MKICLTPGSIGVSAGQLEAIRLAARFGFEAVEPFPNALTPGPKSQIEPVLEQMRSTGLAWGTSGLPVDFRREEDSFRKGLADLPKTAAALKAAGVARVGTWVMPCDDSLTYLQNFRQHARRLKEIGRILADQHLRLGLEYVATHTSLERKKYPFIHTLAEMRDLIAEIGLNNAGVILDSWHWWQAGDTPGQILALRNEDVVSVDLNDAPMGIAKDRQLDNHRELPCATGVIDAAAFLKSLNQIGYDGPVRAEPFNQIVDRMGNDDACDATSRAMRKAFDLL